MTIRLVLWSIFLAAYSAFADPIIPVTADVGGVGSMIYLYAGAMIGIELVSWAFDELMDLLGERIKRYREGEAGDGEWVDQNEDKNEGRWGDW